MSWNNFDGKMQFSEIFSLDWVVNQFSYTADTWWINWILITIMFSWLDIKLSLENQKIEYINEFLIFQTFS